LKKPKGCRHFWNKESQLYELRRNVPYEKQFSGTTMEMALSLPTLFFEAGFFLTLLAVIVLTVMTMGKFQKQDEKTVLKIYTRNFYLRSDVK
jgi:hypothetical protein